MGVELVGCEGRGLGDVVGVGEGAAGEGGLAEDAPPAFLQVEPARADGDEGVVDAGWSSSQVRVDRLLWLDRLSVTIQISLSGLASSRSCRNCW